MKAFLLLVVVASLVLGALAARSTKTGVEVAMAKREARMAEVLR